MDDVYLRDDDLCEQCGSQNFHVEDGNTFCENGHQQAGVHVAEDEADYGNQGKRVRKKDDRSKVKVSKVFRGKKAYKLFLQAYQFILWKQCYALVHQKGLPRELWTVVRDLWTLRISRQLQRLEKSTEATEDVEDQPSSALESGNEPEFDNTHQDVAELSRETKNFPTLVQSIALCYVGILLLRLPIGLATLYRWVREEGVTYTRAIQVVPADMRDKLPGEYHEALDTPFVLTCNDLQIAVYQLSRLYEKWFGMVLPSINWTPLLFEYVKDLALPLEIYKAAKNLNQVAAFDFKFDTTRSRRKSISIPEVQLMSLIVVGVKLLYPFDCDTARVYPRSLNEPSAQRINWRIWAEEHEKFNNPRENSTRLPRGDEIEVKDTDILNMSERQLDQYMDWYQRTWVSTQIARDSVKGRILDMFPLKILPEEEDRTRYEADREAAIEAKLRAAQSILKLQTPISDEDADAQDFEPPRPGSQYAVFRTVQDLARQPVAKAFYEAAANRACLSLETMVRGVVQTERRITIWRNAKKRADRFGDEMDLVAEGWPAGEVGLAFDQAMPLEEHGIGEDEEDASDFDLEMNE